MADVKMPESIPCGFDLAWQGPCKKPSTNGWCTEHEKARCVSCSEKATRQCDATLGALVCGRSLCSHCTHTPLDTGADHITKEAAEAIRNDQRTAGEATVASRKNPVQRMDDKLGVPLNLFEFMKRPVPGFEQKMLYWLELDHGLMGAFPAVIHEERRVIFMTDITLVRRVWKTMRWRRSKIRENMAYVNAEGTVAYLVRKDAEESLPQPVLTEEEFNELLGRNPQPFQWAPGLYGAGSFSTKEQFDRFIDNAMCHYAVA